MLRIHWLNPALLVGLAMTIVATTLGCHASPDGRSTAENRTRVTAANPEQKTIVRTFSQPGQIDPFDIARMYAKVPAYVERYLADIGDVVTGPRFDPQGKMIEHGQLLAELSAPELQQELAQKKALRAQADADVEQAAAAIHVAESGVDAAGAQLKEAEAAIDRAGADVQRWLSEYDRVMQLAARSVVTQKLADETKSQLAVAEAAQREAAARVESARAGVRASRMQLEKAKADEAAVRARRQVAEADEARVLALNDYLRIEAPFDGTISQRHADIGTFAESGGAARSQPLYVLVRTDRVRVFVDLPETEAPLVRVGSRAVVRVRSLGSREFEATVTRTAWALDPDARTLHTEVDVPNPDGALRPGMYAEVSIELAAIQSGCVVPATAVARRQDQAFCFVVQKGTAVRTPVTIGVTSGTEVEITSGLQGDDLVIVKAAGLADGQPIEVVESAAAK